MEEHYKGKKKVKDLKALYTDIFSKKDPGKGNVIFSICAQVIKLLDCIPY